jgi:hypothetical protein
MRGFLKDLLKALPGMLLTWSFIVPFVVACALGAALGLLHTARWLSLILAVAIALALLRAAEWPGWKRH